MKRLSFILLFIIILTGCNSSNKLLGTWYHVDDEEIVILTFYDDNQCTLEELNEKEKCTYELSDKKISINSSSADVELNYDFIDNYLLLGDTRFYKDMKEAKDNKDSIGIRKKVVVGNRIQKIKMPDVTGMNVEEAKKIIEAEDLAVNIIYEYNDYYKAGTVTKTDPKAGTIFETKEAKNMVVDVYVSATKK